MLHTFRFKDTHKSKKSNQNTTVSLIWWLNDNPRSPFKKPLSDAVVFWFLSFKIQCDILLLIPSLWTLGFHRVQAQWYHQGAVPLGRPWQKGDVVGCLVDMDECTMMITLNGELLFDGRGSELAAKDFEISDGSLFQQCSKMKMNHTQFLLSEETPYNPVIFLGVLGLLPVVSVGVNQVGRLNFGRCVASLQYFTVYGQQEGYHPFAANMARDPALWISWQQPQFSSIMPDHPNVQVRYLGSRLLF